MPKSFYEASEETVYKAISACKSASTISLVVSGPSPDFDDRLHAILRQLDADDGVQIKPALGEAGKANHNFLLTLPYATAYAIYSAVRNKQDPEIYEKLGEAEWNLLEGTHAIMEHASSSIRVAIPVGSMTNPSIAQIKSALTQVANGHRQALISMNESDVLFCTFETARKYGFEINPPARELSKAQIAVPSVNNNAVTKLAPPCVTFELQKSEPVTRKKDFGHFRYFVTCPASQWGNFSQRMNRTTSGIMPVNGLYSFYAEQDEMSGLLEGMGLINHPVPSKDEEVYHDTLARRCPWNPEVFGKAYHFNDQSWRNKKQQIEEFTSEYPEGIICITSVPDRGNNLFSGKNYSLLVDDRFISQFSNKLNAKTTLLEAHSGDGDGPDKMVQAQDARIEAQAGIVKLVDFRNHRNKG